ncbi:TraR/DksA family transcriptional regulator [Parvibaculum sp.]|uniref:TraR/DksA family transcriptional regulator n=1 Tax=Parvibaculum sp. TaxID=2024848 RepID=UPI0034A0608B
MSEDALAARFRPLLEAELQALRAESASTAEDRAPVTLDQQSVGRLSRMDALQAQAMAQATEKRRHVRMAQVEAALARIEAGEYGFCGACGEAIAEKRLAADPAAHLCVGCSKGR